MQGGRGGGGVGGGPSELGTQGASLRNVFFTFSSALNSKRDLSEWNPIRSSLRVPSGEIKVVQPKPIVSISRKVKKCFLSIASSDLRWGRKRGGHKKTLKNGLRSRS